MSSTTKSPATAAVQMTTRNRDVLLRAALAAAAETLRSAADEFAMTATNPDALSMVDLQGVAGFVRENLDAIDVLGWEAETIEREGGK